VLLETNDADDFVDSLSRLAPAADVRDIDLHAVGRCFLKTVDVPLNTQRTDGDHRRNLLAAVEISTKTTSATNDNVVNDTASIRELGVEDFRHSSSIAFVSFDADDAERAQ
jgi:hypothetical protein